jgi:hypothetical protein
MPAYDTLTARVNPRTGSKVRKEADRLGLSLSGAIELALEEWLASQVESAKS